MKKLMLVAAVANWSAAHAEVPSVATDIAPVHSLVSQVMGDLGTPSLILPPGASPHGHSLRPSEARALADADLVFWIGEHLTPWLAGAIHTTARNAESIELLEVPGTRLLDFREGARLETVDDGNDGHAEHGADGDGQEHAEDDPDGHDHDGVDPHAWLDPVNAAVWVGEIARALSESDPANAATYAANAQAARARLDRLAAEVSEELVPAKELSYVVFHDAYQYFEDRFDLPARGAISFGDAQNPSAARVAEVRDLIRDLQVTCVAAEPQFNPSLVETVSAGNEVRSTILDPLGTTLVPGPDYYDALLQGLAEALAGCK